MDGLDPNEIFNLGNNQSKLSMDKIGYLGEALGIEPKMAMLPMPPGDVLITFAVIEKVKSQLGYQPAINFKEGLGRFMEWYQQFLIQSHNG